jgi:hypothetical protein
LPVSKIKTVFEAMESTNGTMGGIIWVNETTQAAPEPLI